MARLSSIHKKTSRFPRPPGHRGPLAAVMLRAAAAVLAFQAGVAGGSSLFDEDWRPPVEPALPEQAPTSAPAAGARPGPRLAPWIASGPTQVEAPARLAPPDPAAVAEAEKSIKATHRSDYARKSIAEKAALAKALLGEAQHKRNDPVMLFALLSEARAQAGLGGDPEIAVAAARDTRESFQMTPGQSRDLEQTALCTAIGPMPVAPPTSAAAAVAHRAADLAMELAELDMRQGDYTAAAQAARGALAAARKTADMEFPERVSARTAQIEALAGEFEQDKEAIAGLRLNPADPTANLAAGRFYTFYLDQPQVGLAHLAKGLDPVLRSLAARDLAAGGAVPAGTSAAAGPRHAAAQLAVADAWSVASRTQPGSDPPVMDAMQRRAIFLYENAAGALQGSARVAARQKARDLRTRRAVPGTTGEYYRGQDFAYRLFARTDPQLDFNWSGMPPEFLLAGENFSVRWAGFIKARPGRYTLTAVHNDGVRLWFEGQLIIDKWGANVGRDGAPVELTGGLQELKLEYTQHTGGSYLGLGWVAPGATRACAIPAEAFFHDPLPPGPVYADLTQPNPAGKIELTAAAATMHGLSRFVQGGKDPAHLDHWADPGDWVSWDFEAADGEYDVDLLFSCPSDNAGGAYSLSVGNNVINGPVQSTGSWSDFQTVRAGRARLAAGLQSMQVKSARVPHASLWRLSRVTLTPAQRGAD
jgi:hypothetical protein